MKRRFDFSGIATICFLVTAIILIGGCKNAQVATKSVQPQLKNFNIAFTTNNQTIRTAALKAQKVLKADAAIAMPFITTILNTTDQNTEQLKQFSAVIGDEGKIEATSNANADQVVKLKQSATQSRQKMLDWIIAFGVLVAAVGGALFFTGSTVGITVGIIGLIAIGVSLLISSINPFLPWIGLGISLLIVGYIAYDLFIKKKAITQVVTGAQAVIDNADPVVGAAVKSTLSVAQDSTTAKIVDDIKGKLQAIKAKLLS